MLAKRKGHGARLTIRLSASIIRLSASQTQCHFLVVGSSQISASQARDGHYGTPLHKAAGTANQWGVEELIRSRAAVNAHNERRQSPVDLVAESNAVVNSLVGRNSQFHAFLFCVSVFCVSCVLRFARFAFCAFCVSCVLHFGMFAFLRVLRYGCAFGLAVTPAPLRPRLPASRFAFLRFRFALYAFCVLVCVSRFAYIF